MDALAVKLNHLYLFQSKFIKWTLNFMDKFNNLTIGIHK